MKFSLLFILSGLCAYFFGAYLPHWGLMLVIGIVAAGVGGKSSMAFFSAALAVGAVWFFVPLLIISKTGSDLSEKMATIMGMGSDQALFGATSLVGFLLGGLGALSGNRLRKLFKNDSDKRDASHSYRSR